MVAQIRARRAPGLVGEGHEGVGVSWFFHEALARVLYRGCVGFASKRGASTACGLSKRAASTACELSFDATAVSRSTSGPDLYAIDAAR